jgi:hypothetical protein
MAKYARPAVALLALALAGAGCVINVDADAVTVRDEKRFKVGRNPEVTLETWDGSIKVQTWDRSEVLVEIQKRGPDRDEAAALVVNATQDGNRVRVEAPAPRVEREFTGIGIGFQGLSISYVVSVPTSVTLVARTRDGSINIDGVTGTIELRSGDGSIRSSRIKGALTARTEDGSIQAEGMLEGLIAETGDGSIVVEADDGSSMKDNWNISTGDGSIVLRVPEDFSAEIDASSRDGRVRSDLPGLDHSRGDGDRQSVRGRIGSGGHVVKLRSGDGSINVVSR